MMGVLTRKTGHMSAWTRHRIRLVVLDRDGPWCHWCGVITTRPDIPCGTQMTLDHIKRRRHGGPNNPTNLVIACWDCNQKRD